MLHLIQDPRIPTETELRALSVAIAFVRVGHATRWAIRADVRAHGALAAWLSRAAGETAMLLIEPLIPTGGIAPAGQPVDDLRVRLAIQRDGKAQVAEAEFFGVSGGLHGALERQLVAFVATAMQVAKAAA